MKRLFFLFILFFSVFFSNTSFTQVWQLQNSNFPADAWIMDFSAPNEQVCWAIANKNNSSPLLGCFSRTTDGGNTWVCDTIDSNWDTYVCQVFAMDANTAYIVAQTGNMKGIYKTTDGGSTWNRQDAYNSSLYGPGYIHFFDSQNGFVMGDPNNEAYTTTNGGDTWNPVSMPPPLAGEWGSWNSGNGIAAAGDNLWFSTGKRVYKSTDKGYNWSVILEEPQYTLWWPCIKFQDSQTGIYLLKIQGGTDHIYRRTTDGGANWDTIPDPVLDGLAIGGMSYIPGTTIYVAGGDQPQGMRGVAYTLDSGESWHLIDTSGMTFFEFPSDYVGWGTGYVDNTVWKYVGPPMPIPVEVTLFTANSNRKGVMLNWSTATEVNNKGFDIERRGDNMSFDKIGFVPGFGTTAEPKNYSYSDKPDNSGKYYYRLKQVDYNGSYNYSKVIEVEFGILNSYKLEQNYPNPFNPDTKISWQSPVGSNQTIIVFDVLGNEIVTLVDEYKQAGRYEVEFNAATLSSGVYFYRLQAGPFIDTKKMILLK